MEQMLLGAALKSRPSFELINNHIQSKTYTRPFQIIWEKVADYYARDEDAPYVDHGLILALLEESTPNPKHYDEFARIVESAYVADISEPNVRALVLQAKQKEVGESLAAAIVSNKETEELASSYVEILKAQSLDSIVDKGVEVFRDVNLEELINEELSTEHSLELYPQALGNKLESGVRPGDHIIVYARPETGKTAICLSFSGGFCRQGADGIYFGNEDRVQRLLLRQVSNLTGLTTSEIRQDPHGAMARAKEAGIDHVTFVSLSPGTPAIIEEYVERYKPRWIIVDQLRNLYMKADNRVIQLEAAATALRNIGKRHGCVVISVTQAGDSASGKEVLDMGDVDFSNTGIPAQADVMIGVGVSPALEQQNVRMLSLPKNKLGGDHTPVAVKINPYLSRVTSI